MTAPAGYTTVTGSYLTDASGNPLADGVIYFAPVDNEGNPTSFRVNGNGQAIVRRVSAPVVGGAFSIVLADTSLTSPLNIGYAVSLYDAVTEDELLGPGYECYQPSGSTAEFDTFLPNYPAQTTVNPVVVVSSTHDESLTDGNGNFIFANGDVVTVVGVSN